VLMVLLVLAVWVGVAWWLDQVGRRPVPEGPFDAIVVAGCAVWPGGAPSPALARRVRFAVDLYQAGVAPVIVMTGGVGRHPPAEAVVAARLAASWGVPHDALLIEDTSTNTRENASRTVGLVQGRLLVVSDGYHVYRCVRAFERHHARVEGAGVRGGPRLRRWKQTLREAAAVLRHGARGTL
jgi:uncharacterized SAM-binding protein YcdF (DUF218 family)